MFDVVVVYPCNGSAFSKRERARSMEDFVITRELSTIGADRVQGSKDGRILIQVKNGIVLLNTNENCHGKPKGLSDLFTLARLSVPSFKCENFFKNIAHEGMPKLGEAKVNAGANEPISFTSVSVSDSGVSKNLQCLYLSVTDAYNGIIFTYETGSLNPICILNEEIAELESIETDSLLTEDDMRKLRINFLVWLKGIDYKYLQNPVWPLATSSLFICFTESSEIWVYKYDCFTNTISRVFSFDLHLNSVQNEHVLYYKPSEWLANQTTEQTELYFQFAVVTSKNRVIVRKCLINLSEKSWRVEEEAVGGQGLEFDYCVVNIGIHTIKQKNILSVVLPNAIKIFTLDRDAKAVELSLDNVVVMDNFIQFADSGNSSVLHSILTNSLGELRHIKLDVEKFEVISNGKYNYQEIIESEEIPLFEKLNDLNSLDSFVINSLNMDPTGNLIYMLHSTSHLKSNFEFTNSKKDPISFAIVKADRNSRVDFDDVSNFNSILSSPIYWKGMSSIMKGLDAEVDVDMDVDVKMEAEEADTAHKDDTGGQSTKDRSSLLKELFLNPELDKERVANVIGGASLDKAFKRKIQRMIATEVLALMDRDVLDTQSEEDMFIYFQYSKLVERKIPEKSICKMRVYGTSLIESFDVSQLDIDRCIEAGGVVRSLEGHSWKLCDVTLLPILSPVVKRCTHCGSVKVGGGKGRVLETVLEASPVCVFCGGRYV